MSDNNALQAIETKWLGPTNTRDSRIKATAEAGTITVPYNHALEIIDNHKVAAEALANKFDWLDNGRYRLVGGGRNGNYVWVLVAN